MAIWLVPILAQTLSVAATDRAEVTALFERDNTTAQASNTTSGLVGLGYDHAHWRLGLDYVPSLVLLVPFDDPELVLLWTQAASATAAVHGKHDEFGVRGSVIYGQRDFRRELLVGTAPIASGAEPPPAPGTGAAGTGAPGTGTAGTGTTGGQTPATPAEAQARAAGEPLRFGSVRGEAWYQHQFSRAASFSALAGYGVARSFGETAFAYPTTRSIDAIVSVANRLGRRDALATSLAGHRSSSKVGNRAYTVSLTETLSHRFSARSNGVAGVGVAYNREEPALGEATSSAYPLANVSFSHVRPSRKGVLSLTLHSAFAATIDPISTGIDPRLTAGANVGWNDRRDYALFAGVDTTRSLDPSGEGALQSFSGSLTASWFIGFGFVAETGLRAAWQTYAGAEVVPPTWSCFAALSWAGGVSSGHLFLRSARRAR